MPRVSERQANGAAPIAFGVTTAVGVFYIIVAKSAGLSSLMVTTVPVALMLGYALMILFLKGLRLRSDQTGDNFYYMGFIFTLVSLGVSLYQYSSGGSVDEIIRNFGVAIASTISGIVLRILFNQVRRDPMEVEHASRLELSEAARRVRRELDGVQSEIVHFRRSTQQMLQESFEESQQQLTALAVGATGALEAVSKRAMDNVHESTAGLADQLVTSDVKEQLLKTSRSLDRINKKLESSADQLSQATSTFAERLQSVELPDRVVEVQMQPVMEGLQRVLSQALDRSESHMREIKALRDELLNAAGMTEESNQTIRKLSLAVDEIRERGTGPATRSGFLNVFRRPTDQEIEEASNESETPTEELRVEPKA
jgi:hypothetical protein